MMERAQPEQHLPTPTRRIRDRVLDERPRKRFVQDEELRVMPLSR
jgi:hypothetical protein